MKGPWWRVLARCAVGAAILLNVTKSLPNEVQAIGWAQYQITYEFGFVRRGLIGTIYQYFSQGLGDGDKQRQVLGIHLLLLGGFLFALLRWFWATAKEATPKTRALLELGAAGFLLAPAIPHFENLAGYLDIYLAIFALLAAWALRRKKTALVVAAGVIGPFVHDAFIYWWLSVVALALVETAGAPLRARARRLAPLLPPFLLFPIIMKLHTPDAVVKLADIAGGGDWGKAESLRLMFNIKLGDALPMMGRIFRDNVENWLISFFYALPITAWLGGAAMLALPANRRTWPNAILVAGATIAPSLVLSVGWDLSRLLSWSAVSGAIAIVWSADLANEIAPNEDPAPLARAWRIPSALAFATAAAFATAPLFFTYFHIAFPTTTCVPRFFVRYSPFAWVEEAMTVEYNRNVMPRRAWIRDDCRPGRDRAERIDGEPCAWRIVGEGAVDVGNMRLPPRHYRAKVTIGVSPNCDHAQGTLEVFAWWRYVESQAKVPFALRAGEPPRVFELPFVMGRETSAFGADLLRTRNETGCADVLDARVDPE